MVNCELCGSTSFIKEGEYYVCQKCGSKFTKEQLQFENPFNNTKRSGGGASLLILIIILGLFALPYPQSLVVTM